MRGLKGAIRDPVLICLEGFLLLLMPGCTALLSLLFRWDIARVAAVVLDEVGKRPVP